MAILLDQASFFLFSGYQRFRSTGTKKTLKDEAWESLKAFGTATIEPSKSSKPETSAVQALLGGLTAGVIALILYKFTTTIEAALNRQNLSDSFSVPPSFHFFFVIW